MQILVKTLTGKAKTQYVNSSDSTEKVKAKNSRQRRYPTWSTGIY